METAKPLVSVVITTYNHSSLVRHSIRSVVEQDYRPIEVLVCDDESTDDTPQIAQSLSSDIVKHVRLKHSGFPAVTMAEGMKLARGEIIMGLEGDDQYLPGKIAKQVDYLTAHPECDFVFGDLYYCEGGDEIEKEYIVPDPAIHPTSYSFTGVPDKVTVQSLFSPLIHINTVAMRAKVRDTVLPRRKYRYLWDWDFYIRVVKSGFTPYPMMDILMAYRKHRKGLTSTPETVLRLAEERIDIFDEYKDDVPPAFYRKMSERWRYNWMKESIKFRRIVGLKETVTARYFPATTAFRMKVLYYYAATWFKYTFTSWKP